MLNALNVKFIMFPPFDDGNVHEKNAQNTYAEKKEQKIKQNGFIKIVTLNVQSSFVPISGWMGAYVSNLAAIVKT